MSGVSEKEFTAGEAKSQGVKLLIELGPLAVFFVVNSYAGIFWATAIFAICTLVAMAISWLVLKHVPLTMLISGALVLVFGGLTLAMGDDTYIKLKPTLIYLLFAAVALGGLIARRNIWKHLFGGFVDLDETGWRKLQFRWGCFFLVLALLNEYVWRTYSTDTWVTFKVWVFFPLTLAFALAQIGVMSAHTRTPAPVPVPDESDTRPN